MPNDARTLYLAAPRGFCAGVDRAIDIVVFDFNHPFAGRAVTFDVKLIGVL